MQPTTAGLHRTTVRLVDGYLVIDEMIQRREACRWGEVMSLGVRALSTRADGPAEAIRRAVDELIVSHASHDGSVGDQEFVSDRA